MKFVRFDDRYVIRLMRDEEVVGSLAGFAREHKMEAATASGIGAVRDIEIGYFDPDRRDYIKESFAASHELASLNGTLSIVDGAPTWHLHATIADTEHRIRGGHLFAATVSVTVEVVLTRLPGRMERKWDEAIGLNLLDLK